MKKSKHQIRIEDMIVNIEAEIKTTREELDFQHTDMTIKAEKLAMLKKLLVDDTPGTQD